MVDLGISKQGMITAEDPQDRVSAGDVARSADAIPAGLDQLGEGLGQLAVPLAEQQGREAAQQASVTRDASDQIQVLTPATSFILGRAGDAY